MEITKHRIYQASSPLKSLNSPKRTTKYLASLLLFPVLLSCSSLLIPLLLSCHVHKNYMFLLFNGILVLLRVSCGLGSSYEENDIHEESTMLSMKGMTREKQVVESSDIKQVIVVEEKVDVEEKVESSDIKQVIVVEEKVDVEEKEIHCIEDESLVRIEVEGEENKALISISNDLEGEQGNQRKDIGEDEEDEIGSLSDEELNKKFDDFIRRVREGIKNESQNANSFLISQ